MPHFCPHCDAEIAPGALVKTRNGKAQPKVSKPPLKPNARSRVWQSMRVLRRFTHHELMATAEAGKGNVQRYVAALIGSGHVKCVHESTGNTGDHSVYVLARNSGPIAPRLHQDGTVLDLNVKSEVKRGC